eukprot:scaffold22804_cov74-Phaeocystis_antarctica.AAC.1
MKSVRLRYSELKHGRPLIWSPERQSLEVLPCYHFITPVLSLAKASQRRQRCTSTYTNARR